MLFRSLVFFALNKKINILNFNVGSMKNVLLHVTILVIMLIRFISDSDDKLYVACLAYYF